MATGEHHVQLIILDRVRSKELLDRGRERPFTFEQSPSWGAMVGAVRSRRRTSNARFFVWAATAAERSSSIRKVSIRSVVGDACTSGDFPQRKSRPARLRRSTEWPLVTRPPASVRDGMAWVFALIATIIHLSVDTSNIVFIPARSSASMVVEFRLLETSVALSRRGVLINSWRSNHGATKFPDKLERHAVSRHSR